jgi:hypothetical protein
MTKLFLEGNTFDPNPYWHLPISASCIPSIDTVDLFDQNGYDLSQLELMYSVANNGWASVHRNHHHIALRKIWFSHPPSDRGAVLNHSLLFERKGYSGEAKTQLEAWAKSVPLFWKVLKIRPKWGFDFSIDWTDEDGNVFEILHYEFDGFDYNEVDEQRQWHEQKFLSIDWEDAARTMLARKDEWHNLEFFEQSHWKCQFFGIGKERFKMVLWE